MKELAVLQSTQSQQAPSNIRLGGLIHSNCEQLPLRAGHLVSETASCVGMAIAIPTQYVCN